jgi:hypothetical protein
VEEEGDRSEKGRLDWRRKRRKGMGNNNDNVFKRVYKFEKEHEMQSKHFCIFL